MAAEPSQAIQPAAEDDETDGAATVFESRSRLNWYREVFSGEVSYRGKTIPIPVDVLKMGLSFSRDVPRVLIIPIFLVQLVMFDVTIRAYDAHEPRTMATRLRPYWIVSSLVSLFFFLMMILCPKQFASMFVIVAEFAWRTVTDIVLVTPRDKSSSIGLYMASQGKAYIPFYAAWLVYVVFVVIPQIWWLVLGTTPQTYGVIVPHGFLVYAFLINICLNLGYISDPSLQENRDPIRFFYTILRASDKSILAVLDSESILNEVGAAQTYLNPSVYAAMAYAVLVAVSLEMLLLTLEVSLVQGQLWKYGTLKTMMTDKKHPVWFRRYGRTATLLFVAYIALEIVFEVIMLIVRLVLALSHSGEVSSFVYKNIFLLLVRLPHCFSMMMLMAAPEALSEG